MDGYERWYGLNKKLLSLTGIWPKEKSKEINFRPYFFTFFMLTCAVQQISKLIESDFKMESILKSLYMLIPGLIIMFCYYTVLFNPSKMSKIVDCIERDWEELINEQESIIMQKYAHDSKICTVIILAIVYVFIIFLIFPSVLHAFMYYFDNRNDTVLILPLPAGQFIDASVTYYIFLLHQIVAIIVTATIGSAVLTSFLVSVQHACTLFTIIIARINRPFQKDRNPLCLFDAVKVNYDWIVGITKRYEEAIQFVGLINSLTENTYLVEMVLSMLYFVIDFLYLFQISTLMHNIAEVLTIFIYIPGSIGVLYMNCYFGQRLIDHSMQVLETSSHVPFYDIPSKCHKPLLLLMIRSLKPCKLSIGGVFASSHYFFAELMQKSYSYAMMCYTMR